MVVEQQSLSELSADQLREMVDALLRAAAAMDEQVTRQSTEIRHKQALIDKLTHENALLKRLKFAAQSERYSAEQRSLLDETLEADLQAVSDEIAQLSRAEAAPREKQQPRREPLPANLPRREIHHEPESTTCGCGCRMKRVGHDVAEKLDYQPGVFSVERHVRGKWACAKCQTLTQAPVDAHIIDKGIPTTGLLAQVLVAKYADHLRKRPTNTVLARGCMSGQYLTSCTLHSDGVHSTQISAHHGHATPCRQIHKTPTQPGLQTQAR